MTKTNKEDEKEKDELVRAFEAANDLGRMKVEKRWDSHWDRYWGVILYPPFNCLYATVQEVKDLLADHGFSITKVKVEKEKIELSLEGP